MTAINTKIKKQETDEKFTVKLRLTICVYKL